MADYDSQSIANPTLTEEQLEGMSQCPSITLKRYKKSEKLFEVGDCECKFFVIKTGEVEIVDESCEGSRVITVRGHGQFTGEISQLTGGPALVSAVARTDCEAWCVSSEALQEILNNHPELGDTILQAFIARRHFLRESPEFAGLRVIGSRDSKDTFRVRDFLSRNRVPFMWLDLEADPEVKQLLERFGLSEADTPVVAWSRRVVLHNPTNRQVAEALGMWRPLVKKVFDLVVVGAGPAGLAAAVYGASEGLSTVVLESSAPGGQAGRSMRIENYLGFPTGITGSDLAERAVVQAHRFGANLPVATQAIHLTFDDHHNTLNIDGGETVTARCLLIATGAEYRQLTAEGCEQFEGRGVYYAATPIEAQMCQGSDVVVVGGGNSAGQAAVFLAGQVKKAYLLIRGDDLHRNMSSYLARRVEETPNIEVLLNTEIRKMSGEGHLSLVEIVNNRTKEARTLGIPAVFSFIGAIPRTDWLPAEIERDAKDFVRTGFDLARTSHWSGTRPPFLLETSRLGVFAAGDVRSGSVKRVASAVGEGSMAIQFIHEYLKEV